MPPSLLLLTLALGCAPPAAAPAKPGSAHPAPVAKGPLLPVSPPLVGLHLADLAVSDGAEAAAVLDGDLGTGWRPANPTDASMHWLFAEPVTADRLTVSPCTAGAPMAVEVLVNGSRIARAPASASPLPVPLGTGGHGGRVGEVEVRVSGPTGVCVGEVSLTMGAAPLPVRAPRTVAGTVRASSVLPPAETHHPDLLFDHRTDLGWVEGKAGTGVGESVTVTLQDPLGLVAVDLWQEDGPDFGTAPRLRSLAIGIDKDARLTVPVADAPGRQRIPLPRMAVGRSFDFAVLAIEPGARPGPLGIPELGLVDLYGPVSLVLEGADARRAAVLAQAAGGGLQQDLDESLASLCGGRRLWLGKNLGFHAELPEEAGGEATRADGDWTLGPSTAPWATVLLGGSQRVVPTGWLEPEDAPARTALAAGGVLRLARVEAIGRAGFAIWGKTQPALQACVKAIAGGTGMDPFDVLVKRDAVAVEGALGPDLLAPGE